MNLAFTCIADLKCRTGESPVYDERTGRLYFVDIPSRRLYAIALPRGEPRFWTFESEVCSLGLAASGRLVVALRDSVILFDPATESREEIASIEADVPHTRLNDGKVGPDGAFWVGSLDERPAEAADRRALSRRCFGEGGAQGRGPRHLQRPRLDGRRRGHVPFRFAPGLDRPLAFRPPARRDQRTAPVSPRSTRRPAGPTAAPATPRAFTGAPASPPDASTASRPTERLAATHEVPVPAPTMPCFGGPDFRTLYRHQPARRALARGSGSRAAIGRIVRRRGARRRFPALAVP